MNFGEMIVIVLNKMVVPEYDHIDRVMFKQFGLVGTKRFYEIIYVVKDGSYGTVDFNMMTEIIIKTERLVPMVGLNKHEDYCVYFSNGKKKHFHWER